MKHLFCLLATALLSMSLWAQKGKLLSYTREFEVPDKDPKEFLLSVSVTGHRVLFEMTEIVGLVNGNSLSRENGTMDDFMKKGTEDVRGGLYGWYWRKHDRILRKYLQEFFDEATQLLFDIRFVEHMKNTTE